MEIPPTYRLFEDKDFRNQVNDVGLVVPVHDVERVQLIISDGKKPAPSEQRIIDRFNGEPSKVIPMSELIELPSDIENPLLLQKRLDEYIWRLRDKIENPKEITRIRGLGSGIAIAKSGLTPEPTRLAYALNLNFGEWVPNPKILNMLDINLNYLGVLRRRFNNSRLEETNVVIEEYTPKGEQSGYNRLTLVH